VVRATARRQASVYGAPQVAAASDRLAAVNGIVAGRRRLAAVGALALLVALGGTAAAAPVATTRPTVKPTTPPPPATQPRIAPIPAPTAPASTLPLQTRQPSAHVSWVFPLLSAVGFSVVLLMVAVQWVLTRPGRRGWTL
jgi:hypothetical protein